MSVTFTVPTPSNYLTFVGQHLDKDSNLKEQVFPVNAEPVPSMKSMCAKKILDTTEEMTAELDFTAQKVVLENTGSFSRLIEIKTYCADEAMTLFSIEAMEKMGVKENVTTEKFLRHSFNQLILNSDREKIDEILSSQRSNKITAVNTSFKVMILCKILFVKIARTLNHPTVHLLTAACCIVVTIKVALLFTSYYSTFLLPKAALLASNHLPACAVKAGALLYKYSWTIVLSSLAIKFWRIQIPIVTPVITKAGDVASLVINIPIYIFFRTANKGLNLTIKLISAFDSTSKLLDSSASSFETYRIMKELKIAEDVFVKEFQDLKLIPIQ